MLGPAGAKAAAISTRHAASHLPVPDLLTGANEVESFQPCGATKRCWIDGRPEVLQLLRESVDQLRTGDESHPALYVELTGRDEGKDTKSGGFAEQYDAVFSVTNVVETFGTVPASCNDGGLTYRPSGPPSAAAELKR